MYNKSYLIPHDFYDILTNTEGGEMIRVRVFDIKEGKSYFGLTDTMPRVGTSFTLDLQCNGGSWSTQEVTDVFDHTSSSLKFMAMCGCYEVEILDKEMVVGN